MARKEGKFSMLRHFIKFKKNATDESKPNNIFHLLIRFIRRIAFCGGPAPAAMIQLVFESK